MELKRAREIVKTDLGPDYDVSGKVSQGAAIYGGAPKGCDLFYLTHTDDPNCLQVGGSSMAVGIHRTTEEILAKLSIPGE